MGDEICQNMEYASLTPLQLGTGEYTHNEKKS